MSVQCYFLSNAQNKMISNILKHPDTDEITKIKTKIILAKHYLPWVIKKCKTYKKDKRNILKRITCQDDLLLYAYAGYLHAINNYNGKTAFVKYAENYVVGSLHRGINNLIPLKPISYTQYRKERSKNPFYKIRPPKMVAYEDYWVFDKLYEKQINKLNYDNENIKKLINVRTTINELSNEYQRLFYYRYDINTLKKYKSIKEICDLMSFSHETYYKKMRIILQKIKENYQKREHTNNM
jgi:RNA polymerase sigma factor (sigma-70 family)